MESVKAHAWVVLQLLLCLSPPTASLSLTLPPDPAPAQNMVSSLVGANVLLPCSCPTISPKSVPHVQWCMESVGPILEQRGNQNWTLEEFSGRAKIQESTSGDCSLLLKDLQVMDRGQYYGYMIQDQTTSKTGVFICSVKLLVFDHSSVQSLRPGEDLVLELHTPHAMSLVFKHSNSSEWRSLWRRGGPCAHNILEDHLNERLRLKSVSAADEGVYKVLDANGLTVSSTWLTLGQHNSTLLNLPDGDSQRLTDTGITSTSWPALLLIFISVSGFAM